MPVDTLPNARASSEDSACPCHPSRVLYSGLGFVAWWLTIGGMDHADAERLAQEMMAEHGLRGWAFRWDRGKRRLGSCSSERKTISLSHYYVALNDEPHVRGTILHEIAHAIAGCENGHNHVWKRVCRRIGADPTRCDRTAALPDAPYHIYCPVCERSLAPRHRRMRRDVLRRMSCRRCGRRSRGKLVFEAASGEGVIESRRSQRARRMK